MPRTMSSDMLAAITGTILRPAIFVSIAFADGTYYLWSGVGTISWNGQNWLGIGTFGGISVIEEATTVEAKGITLTLSGIDPTMLADALQNMELGLPVSIYLGLFTTGESPTLIDTPLTIWSGRIDQPTIDISGQNAAMISINCESRLIDMNIAIDRRYTIEDSEMDNPGDLGFAFVDGIQEMTFFIGAAPQSQNNV